MHISSMGEFEQGAPLIDELLARFPDAWIVVSLFSPSAYEHLTFDKERTVITYLPFDVYRNAVRFVDRVRPSIHIIIRHDIWPNYQWILQKRGIPSLLVSASISDERLTSVKRWRRLYRHVYASFSAICVISEMQKERLALIYPHEDRIKVCGDTRYDRVYARAMDTKKIDFLKDRFNRERCLVAGSTWPADEKIVMPGISKALEHYEDFRVIIAPHEISSDHLESIEAQLSLDKQSVVRLSNYKKSPEHFRVLLVDSIGLLANLYALGAIAYVGGGFGVGVHSVLEPAAHGAVICYGPNHRNSPEAREMAEQKIATPIATAAEFQSVLFDLLEKPQHTSERGEKTKTFVLRNVGASRRTADVAEHFTSR